MKQHPLFQLSADSRLLIGLLDRLGEGDTITYGRIEEELGRSLHALRNAIATARRHLCSDNGIVFGTVRGIGLKRLKDAEIIASTDRDRHHVRRTVRGAAKKLAVVQRDNLSTAERCGLDTRATVFALIGSAAKEASLRKIESKVAETQCALPLGRTLEVLKGMK